MKNADRDSAARQLGEILNRLDVASASAEESASTHCKAHPSTNQQAFQLGSLEQLVRNEVNALRMVINTYLTPTAPRPRGARTRR